MFAAFEVQNKRLPRRHIRNMQFLCLRSYLQGHLAPASWPAQKHNQTCSNLSSLARNTRGSQAWCPVCSTLQHGHPGSSTLLSALPSTVQVGNWQMTVVQCPDEGCIYRVPFKIKSRGGKIIAGCCLSQESTSQKDVQEIM